MKDRPDLDPRDTDNRLAFRDRMQQIRKTAYGSLRGLRDASVEAGLGARFVEDCEDTAQWSVRRVQAWSRLFGHRFSMTITGLIVPDDGDVTAIVLADAVTFGWADEDQLHIKTVVNDLARIRCAHGTSYYEFGRLARCSNRAVASWEDFPERCYLKTVQRYCRGLGGELALDVVPATVAVSA